MAIARISPSTASELFTVEPGLRDVYSASHSTNEVYVPRFWLSALALSIVFSISTFADDAKPADPKPAEPKPQALRALPRIAQDQKCDHILTWHEAAGPKGQEVLQLEKDIEQVRLDLRNKKKSQGKMTRRTFSEGARVLEDILSMIAGHYTASVIYDRIADFIIPAFDASVDAMVQARKIHTLKKSSMPDQQELRNAEAAYKAASIALGQNYSRYLMIMSALSSIANQAGLSHMTTERSLDPIRLKDGVIEVYDLKSIHSVNNARAVLEQMEYELEARLRIALPDYKFKKQDEVLSDDDLPFPSFNVVKENFKINPMAFFANRAWDLKQQGYTSRPFVLISQILSDAITNLTGYIPNAKLRSAARTLIGLGNRDSVMARYLPDILEIVGITRALDDEGNMVISGSSYYLNLQLQRLFNSNADGTPNDDLLVTFARIDWFRPVWSALVDEMARQANVKVSSKWAPKGLTNPDILNLEGDDDPVVTTTSMQKTAASMTVADDKPPVKKDDSSATKKSTSTTSSGDKDPGNAGSNSQLASYRLQQLLAAEARADKLKVLKFTDDDVTWVAMRFVMVQLLEWGIPIEAHQHWPWVQEHIVAPATSILPHFGH
jgi:hypothetical protein